MHKLIECIDSISEKVGSFLLWLVLPMTLIATYNAVARYISKPLGTNLSSNALLEIQWYLFSVIFLMGAAYVYKHDGHVRVDILYNRFSFKMQNIIQLLGNLLLALPFCIITAWACLDSVLHSWSVLEMSPDPGGLPRYPIKTLIPCGLVLLALQSLSMSLKAFSNLIGISEPIDSDPPSHSI